jgi:hypothetical protein
MNKDFVKCGYFYESFRELIINLEETPSQTGSENNADYRHLGSQPQVRD